MALGHSSQAGADSKSLTVGDKLNLLEFVVHVDKVKLLPALWLSHGL